MKGGVAAALVAAKAVRKVLGQPKRRLRLALLADEEGGMTGVKAFVRAGLAQGFAGAIVCEPEENEICLWQKGALRLLVELRGRMSHGAMPYAGANPIPCGVRFLALVETLEKDLQTRFQHPELGLPHLTPTRFMATAGEGQLNVIPGRAELALDLRTLPGMDHRGLVEAVEALLLRAQEGSGVAGGVSVLEDRPPVETPREAKVVRALEAALQLLGLPVRYGGVPGATDGTFLAAWAGLPVAVMGPGGRSIPHQVDEYVEVQALVDAARVYAAAAVIFLEGR